MLYITTDANNVVTNVSTTEHTANAQSRWDWDDSDIEVVEKLAEQVSEFTGEKYVVTLTGCRPQYDIIKMPMVGDDISYSFNGDTRPCGQIARVSQTGKLITSTEGHKFYRAGEQSGCWVMNKTWSMLRGHRDERNPHL